MKKSPNLLSFNGIVGAVECMLGLPLPEEIARDNRFYRLMIKWAHGMDTQTKPDVGARAARTMGAI